MSSTSWSPVSMVSVLHLSLGRPVHHADDWRQPRFWIPEGLGAIPGARPAEQGGTTANAAQRLGGQPRHPVAVSQVES